MWEPSLRDFIRQSTLNFADAQTVNFVGAYIMRVRVRTVRRDKAVWTYGRMDPFSKNYRSLQAGNLLWNFVGQPTLKLCRPTYFETLQAPDGQLCRCLHYIRGTQWICQSTLKRCRPTYFETLQAPDGQLCRCLTFYTRLIYLVHGAQRATLRLVTACHLGIYLYTEYMVAWYIWYIW